MSEAAAIRKIQGARARKRAKADEAKREATDELRAYIREAQRRASRSLGLLRRPVFLGRAFTTYWGSDLPHSGVELPFGRDRDLEPLLGLLLTRHF